MPQGSKNKPSHAKSSFSKRKNIPLKNKKKQGFHDAKATRLLHRDIEEKLAVSVKQKKEKENNI